MDRALSLVRPSPEWETGYLAFMQEVHEAGSTNGYLLRVATPDFRGYVGQLTAEAEGVNLPEGWMPQSTFWLTDGKMLLGEGRLRHRLSPALLEKGGNIGFLLRPLARGKGLGKVLLRLLLSEARNLGLDRVLLTCDAGNRASARTIEECGGVLEDQPATPGQDWLRYWISLT